MPNPVHNLMIYGCPPNTNSYSINAKPMGAISSTIDVNRTLACILSMPNQWARSRQLSMSKRTLAGINHCQTTGQDLMSYQCQPDTSLYSVNTKPLVAILSAIDVNNANANPMCNL